MREYLKENIKKILVIVNDTQQEEKILHAAKQLSEKYNMPWMILYLISGIQCEQDHEDNTTKIFERGMKEGAESVTFVESEKLCNIKTICQQHHVSKIVVANQKRIRFIDRIRRSSFIDQILSLEHVSSVIVLRDSENYNKRASFYQRFVSSFPNIVQVSLLVCLLAGINSVLHHYFGMLPYHSVGLFFLLEITILGLFFPLFVTIWAAVLASQIWNVFFIPPLFTFSIDSPDDFILCISFIVISSIVGGLTNIINKKNRYLKAQGAKTNILYSLSNEIVESQDSIEAMKRISILLSSYFNGYISITTKNDHGVLDYFKRGNDWKFNAPKNWKAVQCCCDNNMVTGKWTDVVRDASGICFPLSSNKNVFGVLSFIPSNDNCSITNTDREMLHTVSRQLGLLFEKEFHQKENLITEKLKESEKLHQTLLNSVSHELKTPLTTIGCIADSLINERTASEDGFNELRLNLSSSVLRLTQVVDNILDMSRIDGGRLELRKDWVDFRDVIDNVKEKFQAIIGNYIINISLQSDFPLVYIDATFIEQVFFNLFSNSLKYASPGSHIKLTASFDDKNWFVFFGDNGPGILPHEKELIFGKFYRGSTSKTGGIGLGMTIVKSIIELHQGSIEIVESDSGLQYRILFPLNEVPPMPADT